MKHVQIIREALSPNGQRLLKIIVDHVGTSQFIPGDPSTYLGDKDCCVVLNLVSIDEEIPWGRFLQQHGLNDLNEWTKQFNLPRLSGLIVNQRGDRQYWPGGDYFKSNGQPDMDGAWWEDQAYKASQFNWRPFV